MINWTGVDKDSDGSITIKKLSKEMIPLSEDNKNSDPLKNIRIGILDIETNGLDCEKDSIIEIGLAIYEVNRDTGKFVSLVKEYQALQEIKEPLSQKIINITNLTDEMLKGQEIDWSAVNDMISDCDYVIAHNTYFDRGFIDPQVLSSINKIWGCSLRQIDWTEKGFHSASLVNLCVAHGIHYEGHRAINDVEATAYLLQQKVDSDSSCYLKQLLDEIDKPQKIIIAHKYPNNKKDVLKNNGFTWAGDIWSWTKIVNEQGSLQKELKWLETKVYGPANYSYVVEIEAMDNFKTFKSLMGKYKFEFKKTTSKSKDYKIDLTIPKEKRQLVKDRSYRWDGDNIRWYFEGSKEEVKAENDWLKNELPKLIGEAAGNKMNIKIVKN